MPPRRRSRAKRPSASRRSTGRSRSAAPPALTTAPRSAPRRTRSLDWLHLTGIQAYGHLGVTSKERDLGQRVEADVEIAYERNRSRPPDSLDAYVDYEEVGRLVRSQIEMSRCKLIETLAEEVAFALLEETRAPRVRVRIRKLHVPVSGFSGIPQVEIERES